MKIGENTLAFYRATNTSDKPITGTAVFNVAPELAGVLLQQGAVLLLHRAALEPGQTADMAVSFYVDPNWTEDDDTKDVSELTLSYTFYPAPKPKREDGRDGLERRHRAGGCKAWQPA